MGEGPYEIVVRSAVDRRRGEARNRLEMGFGCRSQGFVRVKPVPGPFNPPLDNSRDNEYYRVVRN